MKKRKWIIIGSLFLAAAIFLLGVSDYTQNIAPRLESIGLTYRPFSGKLFDLAPAQVRSVFIRRGIPGREQEYGQDSRACLKNKSCTKGRMVRQKKYETI